MSSHSNNKELLTLIAQAIPQATWVSMHNVYSIVTPGSSVSVQLTTNSYLFITFNGHPKRLLCFLARPGATADDRCQDCTPEEAVEQLLNNINGYARSIRIESRRLEKVVRAIRYPSTSNLK
jgi:hypothetical protein